MFDMVPRLILLFNHLLTEDQEADARRSLGVEIFLEPPADLREIWANVPPDLQALGDYLDPVRLWVEEHGRPGDFVLVQGDFGATCLMAAFGAQKGLIPVYATTRRQAVEEPQPDGSVKLTHRFRHVRFRRFGG